jgi:3-dehydroquinate dehydratase-2
MDAFDMAFPARGMFQRIYASSAFTYSAFIRASHIMAHRLIVAMQPAIVTILILQGPHAARSLSGELFGHLQQLARAAGRTLELCPCGGLRDLIARVRAVKPQSNEFMLLDPGDLTQQVRAHPEAGLCAALDGLATPYIEVHDDSDDALESQDRSQRAPLATIIINGDLATSYQIALGIALRQLGTSH